MYCVLLSILDFRFREVLSCHLLIFCIIPDNIDTRSVLEAIRVFVGNANTYIEKKRTDGEPHNRNMMKNAAAYITQIFDVFGLIAKPEEIGFPTSQGQAANVRYA